MKRFFKNKFVKWSLLLVVLIGSYITWYFTMRVPDYNLETLSINISQESYQKLSSFRDVALENGLLERSDDDYVPAEIKYRSQIRMAEIRLKGDWTDHLRHKKWSFRIKMKESMDDGLKIFSVQNLATRGYLKAYVFHQLLKQENVLTNEFRFIHVKVNEESWGLYCLEEHLTDRMIANQGKDDGVILKFTDDPYFAVAQEKDAITDGLIKDAEIKTYGGGQNNSDQILDAKQIMLNYQFQKGDPFIDFDSSITAKYYAICDLATAYHAMGWINVRFYYNFNTEKMEPIGYDGYPELDWGKPFMGANFKSRNQNPFENIMIIYKALKNEGVYNEYMATLERITHPNYVEKFMKKRKSELEFLENEIQKEYSSYEFDFNALSARSNEIRAAMSQSN